MNLTITQYTINKLSDNGKLLIEFPANTILDLIDKDLWNIIIKYYHKNRKFAIGLFNKEYLGYHSFNLNDKYSESLIKELAIQYNNYGFFTLDDHDGGYIYLSYFQRLLLRSSDGLYDIFADCISPSKKNEKSFYSIKSVNNLSFCIEECDNQWNNYEIDLFVQDD